jgi:hypothetical protein
LYNPQSLNRYAYALNNPLKYTDPTGHTVISDDYEFCKEMACGGAVTLSILRRVFRAYGVTLTGNWSFDAAKEVYQGVEAVGNRLGDARSMSSRDAFKSVYHNGMEFEWVDDACSNCYAKTLNDHHIKFYAQYWGRSGAVDASGNDILIKMNTPITPNLAIHELGHAFNVLASRHPENYVANYTGKGGSLIFRDQGVTDGFFAGTFTGQLSADLNGSEIFADMFLGWVSNEWGNNTLGADRETVMTTNMGGWITESLK